MKIKRLLWIGVLVLLTMSCEELETPIEEPTQNYYPLEIGNYWVYNHFRIDTLQIKTEIPHMDSVIIERDTVINNKKYYILEGTNYITGGVNRHWEIIDMLRDSLGYIINHKGDIKFSLDNFTDTLFQKVFYFPIAYDTPGSDTAAIITFKMEMVNEPIVVNAVEFNEVLNFKGTLQSYRVPSYIDNPRSQDIYFAKDVGKIIETFYYHSYPFRFEKRLVRYKIN